MKQSVEKNADKLTPGIFVNLFVYKGPRLGRSHFLFQNILHLHHYIIKLLIHESQLNNISEVKH